jgi:hypothetical protein
VYKVGADGSEEDEPEQRPATIYALDSEVLLLRKPDLLGSSKKCAPAGTRARAVRMTAKNRTVRKSTGSPPETPE